MLSRLHTRLLARLFARLLDYFIDNVLNYILDDLLGDLPDNYQTNRPTRLLARLFARLLARLLGGLLARLLARLLASDFAPLFFSRRQHSWRRALPEVLFVVVDEFLLLFSRLAPVATRHYVVGLDSAFRTRPAPQTWNMCQQNEHRKTNPRSCHDPFRDDDWPRKRRRKKERNNGTRAIDWK